MPRPPRSGPRGAMIQRRGPSYFLYRRVPARFAAVEDRRFLRVSLHTDSETEAKAKAAAVWAEAEAAWQARLDGDTSEAEARYEAARALATARGFRFLPAAKVARLHLDELLARIDAAHPGGRLDEREAAALLGGAEPPALTVSQALEAYWPLTADKRRDMSEDQVRRWRLPRKRAVANFLNVVGDVELAEIGVDEMLAFREWWMERLDMEGLKPASANKDLIHLAAVLRTVIRMKRLGLTIPTEGLRFADAARPTIRPAFSTDWISDVILRPGAMAEMDDGAADIVLVMVNTGARPSEIANLQPERIRLEDNVPHVLIEPDGRRVKTKHAIRRIPLVGVSFEAMRRNPEGFERWRDNPSLSAAQIGPMRRLGLMESPAHVVYSLRHSFEQRMVEAKIDDRVRRDLFGHRLTREKYGETPLHVLAEAVQAVAL